MKLILNNQTNFNSTRKRIQLQTSEGNDIENYQISELAQYEINSSGQYETKYPLLKFKGQLTAMYNCHGFTFASRRTNIDPQEIQKILKDDKYIRIEQKNVMCGDIVAYIDDESGDIMHTGMINYIDNSTSPSCIWVLGKWGKYKEVSHPLYDCEYKTSNIQFWRNNHGCTKI